MNSRDALQPKLVSSLITVAETARCDSYTHPHPHGTYFFSQAVNWAYSNNIHLKFILDYSAQALRKSINEQWSYSKVTNSSFPASPGELCIHPQSAKKMCCSDRRVNKQIQYTLMN